MRFTSSTFTLALSVVASTSTINAFSVYSPSVTSFVVSAPRTAKSMRANAPALFLQQPQQQHSEEDETEQSLTNVNALDCFKSMDNMGKIAMQAVTAWAVTTQVASAAGPDWGIFEGRIGSLLHPTMMVSLLTFSIWTGSLGFAWRRQRTMGDEISTLKKTVPDLQGATNLAAALAAAKSSETVDTARVQQLQSAIAEGTETKIAELVAERKALVAANPKDQHFSQGALLAFLGTAFAIEGPLNTYARAGKLFPGPHLYAGAGLVVLWGLAVACVPAMQKGNDTARTVHIGANAAGLGLFGWQVVSGWPILLKVLEKTQFP